MDLLGRERKEGRDENCADRKSARGVEGRKAASVLLAWMSAPCKEWHEAYAGRVLIVNRGTCRIATRVSRLTDTDVSYILCHMKTTLNIDDEILAKAARLTGVKEKTTLVRMGLEALVARNSAQRLAALGGSEPSVRPVPRRRTA